MPEPDKSFMRDLKSMDRRLAVKWNHDVGNFIVTYDRGHGEPVNIHRVNRDDGGFRQPDKRDLMILKGGDLAQGDDLNNRISKLAYMSDRIRKEQRRKAKSEIRDMTKDNKLQLKRFLADKTNEGKGNAEFRRVPHKPSKRVVKVIP